MYNRKHWSNIRKQLFSFAESCRFCSLYQEKFHTNNPSSVQQLCCIRLSRSWCEWLCVFTVWAWPLWPPWLWWRPERALTAALLAQLVPVTGHSSAGSGWWKASSPPAAFLAWEFLKSWQMGNNEGHWFETFTWCEGVKTDGFTRCWLTSLKCYNRILSNTSRMAQWTAILLHNLVSYTDD